MRKKGSNTIKILIAMFFLVSVIFPLFQMLIYIGDVDIVKLITSDGFITALKNSLLTSITATLISIAIAFVLSWGITRTKVRFKSIFSVVLTLPMLIPSISHGMGLVILFGTNGIVTIPIVSMPRSLATRAITGAAPVPVPPPIPAVMKTILVPSLKRS